MRGLIDEHGPLSIDDILARRPSEPYAALLRAIVGQQLSTKAAESIFGRLIAKFDGRGPTPSELIAMDPEELRSVGLSHAKVAYLRDLAERVEDGELQLDLLKQLPDEEVSAQLTAVKGVGQWTADMFLMFNLGRPDVFPVGDLGIRNAMKRLYELPEKPAPADYVTIAEPWRPYRSLASLYLWTALRALPV
jgi:DNA-3-methyladenine glycosylase II